MQGYIKLSISPAQCRAARSLIGWSQDKLSEESKVAKATIANFEAGKRSPYERTLDDIQEALEKGGVIFIAADEMKAGGAGVRFDHNTQGD